MYTVDASTHRSPNFDDREGADIDIIVIHATAGTATTDLPHLKNPAPYNPKIERNDPTLRVSCHYYITKAGMIYQLVDDVMEAFHAGTSHWGKYTNSVNNVSLGIELENKNDGKDLYPDVQVAALTWLVEWKARQYDVSIDNIVTHEMVATPKGRKNDPLGFPFEKWRNSLTIDKSEGRWQLWGTRYPLYDDQKGWAIQQTWLKHADRLGEARSYEDYLNDWSIRCFEHGLIMYRNGKTLVVFADDIGK